MQKKAKSSTSTPSSHVNTRISVIAPVYDAAQLKLPTDRQPGVIYLPADFFSFRLTIRRLWIRPKIGRLNLLMDPVGLRPAIVGDIPDHREISVQENAVGDCMVPAEQKNAFARRQAIIALRSKYKHLYWEPGVEIIHTKSLYKAIFIDRWDGQTWLYDTYSGKKILVENAFFEPKPKP